MPDIRKEVIYLRWDFTEEEMKQFSLELARAAANQSEAEEAKKAAGAQFSEKIARAKADVSSLARKINNGYELRNIECSVTLDKPKKGWATITRLDTGKKVSEREMTAQEKQRELPLEETPTEKA